jgi:uncharacterized protein (DUF697 family)
VSEQTREIVGAIVTAAFLATLGFAVGVVIMAYLNCDGLHSVLAKPIKELP